ncbi:hypothetical protein FACS189454_09370 [Planctomycetales bacterium]|nr:hypothetical protein FACS189454_09370 [Planctomycetales bacterium]
MKKSRSSKQDKPADKEQPFVFMNDDGSITVNSPAAIKHLGQAYFAGLLPNWAKWAKMTTLTR